MAEGVVGFNVAVWLVLLDCNTDIGSDADGCSDNDRPFLACATNSFNLGVVVVGEGTLVVGEGVAVSNMALRIGLVVVVTIGDGTLVVGVLFMGVALFDGGALVVPEGTLAVSDGTLAVSDGTVVDGVLVVVSNGVIVGGTLVVGNGSGDGDLTAMGIDCSGDRPCGDRCGDGCGDGCRPVVL